MNYSEYMHGPWGNERIRANMPTRLQKAIKNFSFLTDTWTQGRTLANAVSRCSNELYELGTLFRLLTYIAPNHTTVHIRTAYATYDANTTLTDHHDIIPGPGRDFYHTIWIKHIPKGTTFTTNILDNAEQNDLIRLRNIENQLIVDSKHFIRVYKSNNGYSNYTLLTNYIDAELISKFTILIPIMIGCPYASEDEIENEETEAGKTQLKLQNAILNAFTNLYDFSKDAIDSTVFEENLKNIFEEIIVLKGLDKVTLADFMNNFATLINTKVHRQTQNELDAVTRSITSHEQDLEALYSKKQMLNKQLMLIKDATPDDVQPFITSLQNNKCITILDADDTDIKIKVTAPLQFFDSSDFKRYEANDRSYLHDNEESYGADSRFTLPILHKIFVTHEYKLLLDAIITLRTETARYNSDTLYVFAHTNSNNNTRSELTNLPNPHLYYYDCWEKTKQQIRKAVTEGNYDLIPTLIVNSVQTINVAENTSFFKLLRDLTEADWRAKTHLITKSGETITWQNAIDIEKESYKDITEVEVKPEITETVTEETHTVPRETTGLELLRTALHAQTTQEYTQVVIEEDNTPINTDEEVTPEF